jgi:hypothetical protein
MSDPTAEEEHQQERRERVKVKGFYHTTSYQRREATGHPAPWAREVREVSEGAKHNPVWTGWIDPIKRKEQCRYPEQEAPVRNSVPLHGLWPIHLPSPLDSDLHTLLSSFWIKAKLTRPSP